MKKLYIYLFILLVIIGITPLSFAVQFNDIESVPWAKDAIVSLSENGFINGYADGSFKPMSGITRAELVKIINRMNLFSDGSTLMFSDVNKSDWFYKEIGIAVKSGSVKGYPDGTFRPNDPVTREQVAVILNNLYKFEETTLSFNIEDYDEISSWAAEAVEKIVGNGFMSGYPDGTFRGANPITRAEAVLVLNKIYGKIGPLTPVLTDEKPQTTDPVGQIEIPTENSIPNEEPEEIVILRSVVSQLEALVFPSLTTTLQRDTMNLVIASVSRYLEDQAYDITQDVEQAKGLIRQMSDEERLDFENAITTKIPLADLHELNRKFRLVNY